MAGYARSVAPFDHQAIVDTADREALMGGPLNKVSFRRKMTEMDMLEAIDGAFSTGGAHRPAQLHRL